MSNDSHGQLLPIVARIKFNIFNSLGADCPKMRHCSAMVSAAIMLTDDNGPYMTTSWHENTFYITGFLSPHRGPIMRIFDIFYVGPKNVLETQSSCRWFEIPWGSCDVIVMVFVAVYVIFGEVLSRPFSRQGTQNRRYIARPWGRAMERLIWVQTLVDAQPLSTVVLF